MALTSLQVSSLAIPRLLWHFTGLTICLGGGNGWALGCCDVSGGCSHSLSPVPVSKPFVRPTAAAAAEGAAVALTCTVREGTEPLSFSWQHQEPRGGPSVTPAGLGGSRAELRLTPANRSHTGWYVCTVSNEVNNHTSDPVYLDIVCECPGGALSCQLGGHLQGW